MPRTNDTYKVKLYETHLGWGTHRYTYSRDRINGEGYIPIPKVIAERFKIYNSNYTNHEDILGINIFNCFDINNNFICELKAQGACRAGDIYAKNFSAKGDLKLIGRWLQDNNATVGSIVKITFINETDLIIEII